MADVTIEVDVRSTIRRVDPRVIGINIDYLVDHDANRPAGARPLAEALKEMGVRSLRFPGGDKSDNHLWSVPPFDRPNPALACGPRQGREEVLMTPEGDWKVRLLDFDEFIQLCRAVEAEPIVVACYDALFAPGCTIDRERLIETAAAWVEYANKKRDYGVTYWEIGNEGYIDENVSPYDYARDLVDFAAAMKSVDPSIKIGANGPPRTDGGGHHAQTSDTPWWQVVFEAAADHIDFAAIHVYSCWRWVTYDAYRDHGPGYPEAETDATSPLRAAEKWGPPGFADRLRLAATELNAADWSEGGWPKVNDLGHALVAFDIFGTLLELDSIDMAQLWNTRWVTHPPDTPSLWDAVDDANQLQPTGTALSIWSRFLNDAMVRITEPPRMRTFASYSADTRRLSVFLLNKDVTPRSVSLIAANSSNAHSARLWTWRGEGPDDLRPIWSGPKPLPVQAGKARLSLPPDSLTVIELEGV